MTLRHTIRRVADVLKPKKGTSERLYDALPKPRPSRKLFSVTLANMVADRQISAVEKLGTGHSRKVYWPGPVEVVYARKQNEKPKRALGWMEIGRQARATARAAKRAKRRRAG